jgi:hypothetical protein
LPVPGLRIERTYSWAVASGELGGLAGEFYRFANSIREELIPASRAPGPKLQVTDSQSSPEHQG